MSTLIDYFWRVIQKRGQSLDWGVVGDAGRYFSGSGVISFAFRSFLPFFFLVVIFNWGAWRPGASNARRLFWRLFEKGMRVFDQSLLNDPLNLWFKISCSSFSWIQLNSSKTDTFISLIFAKVRLIGKKLVSIKKSVSIKKCSSS